MSQHKHDAGAEPLGLMKEEELLQLDHQVFRVNLAASLHVHGFDRGSALRMDAGL